MNRHREIDAAGGRFAALRPQCYIRRMNWNSPPASTSSFPPPRQHPLLYPGARPEGSFMLSNGSVFPIAFNGKASEGGQAVGDCEVLLNAGGDADSIDNFLASRKADSIRDRFPVIGYGSNPVPGQLSSKLGGDAVVPVIYGTMENCNIVYNLISDMGSAYADMVFGRMKTTASVGITFLDRAQLQLMIESERNYRLAYSPVTVTLESGRQLQSGRADGVFIFAGIRKIWVPLEYKQPAAIAGLSSANGSLKLHTQPEILDLVVREFELRSAGIADHRDLADRLRQESSMEEKPGKLKYDIQSAVESSPRSLPALADHLDLVENASCLCPFSDKQ